MLRESYPNHTRITPVSYLKPSTSRPWHILNAWVRYFTSLHNPENKTSFHGTKAMAWTNHLLSGTNVLPTASYALNQLYLLSELASGFTCTWESQTLALGGWFRPENHTCLSLSIYIFICVQGYTQRYIKGWKVCWKPLRYEVSSMWWSTCEAYPEAYPRSKPRSIPPKHTP